MVVQIVMQILAHDEIQFEVRRVMNECNGDYLIINGVLKVFIVAVNFMLLLAFHFLDIIRKLYSRR